MSKAEFDAKMREVAGVIGAGPFDAALADKLNARYPAGGAEFETIAALCREGIAGGWLCENEQGGIRYGRPVEPSDATAGLSVDVVFYRDKKGPYHRHPGGEVCMVVPTDGDPKFDGKGAGWCVYGPDSAHYPAISGGEAIVLYLLPGGAIDFKARPAA
jgi:hypothetical protein